MNAKTKRFRLSYNQPTIEGGKVVPGKTWYVSQLPGDGGKDWGYTLDPNNPHDPAILVSLYWVRRFRKLHGTRVNALEIES